MIFQKALLVRTLKWIRKSIPYIALTVCLVIIISIWLGNQEKHTDALPKNLYGKWKTSNKKYQDRFFKLEKRLVTIGIGGKKFELYRVSNIRIDNVGNIELYTIVCGDTLGLEFTLSFYYDHKKQGIIRFKNKPNIEWKKASS